MKNVWIDRFRAIRVLKFGQGRQGFHDRGQPALLGTPLGRGAEPLPLGGRGSESHGQVRRLHRLGAGGFRTFALRIAILSHLVYLILAFPAIAANDVPAVTGLRIGSHDFGARLVIDLTAEAEFEAALGADGRALIVRFPEIDWYSATRDSFSSGWMLDRYAFELTGQKGGKLIIYGDTPFTLLKSFRLSPSGESGHRLVFDLAESPGAPPTAVAGPQRDDPPTVHGTPSADHTEPSLRAPIVTSSTELPATEIPLPPGVGGDRAVPPIDPLAALEAASKDAGDSEKRFILNEVTVNGTTVAEAGALDAFYGDAIGKPVSLKDLNVIADKMTASMRNQGYLLYKVIVPEQKIADGRVRLQAIEGFINQVVVEGGFPGRSDLWRHWTRKIQQTRPITVEVLERYTLLANDQFGFTVKSVLRPSEDVPGASDLVLKVTHKPIDASLSIDNRASETTGPREGTLTASASNVLRGSEKFTLTYNIGADRDAQEYIGLQADMMLNGEGTTATFSGSSSTSAPGDSLKDLELTSDTLVFAASLNHPLLRRRDETLKLFGGFTITNSDSDALSARLYEDKLRTLNGGISYSLKDSFDGENAVTMQFSQGFEWFGASEEDTDLRSRSNGQNDFSKMTVDASRLQRLPKNFSLSATFTGQWASAPLLSSEEFSFGGSSYGRAYDSSEITGDHGMALALELQHTSQPGVPYVKYLQPYAFWDFGSTWDIDADGDDEDSALRTGASAGLGVRLGLTDYFSASLEFAKPLTRAWASADEGEENDPRLFFSLSGTY